MGNEDVDSSQTMHDFPFSTADTTSKLDLSYLPPIFVSATHFDPDNLHELEESLTASNANLTYDVHEARIVLSKVTKKARIQFDLRGKGLWTEEATLWTNLTTRGDKRRSSQPPAKKQKYAANEHNGSNAVEPIVIEDSSTESEAEAEPSSQTMGDVSPTAHNLYTSSKASIQPESFESVKHDEVLVVSMEWFVESRKAGKVLSLQDYISYRGRHIEKPTVDSIAVPRTPAKSVKSVVSKHSPPIGDVIRRAEEDAPSSSSRFDTFRKRKFGRQLKSTSGASWRTGQSSNSQLARLLHTTTSENDEGYSSDLPPMPNWVSQGVKYACQRRTPRDSPNDSFISLLKKIKVARELTNDEIGVRAYSTSIASLAAYPYELSNPREILVLPGCDVKIANLFIEWKNTGKIKAVEDLEADEELKVLHLFYGIWGVGALTARDFYLKRGWCDLDDVVVSGWDTLTRVQQIGVKYYDEFLDLIPRTEVEEIGRIIHRHAVKVRDEGIQSMIVGGYRRGKEASGDVDIVVSHPNEMQTLGIVSDIVTSLEEEEWITHTLLLSLNGSHRDQQTLPYRTGGGGHGFDTLDKALVVWQDPTWPSRAADLAADPNAKNPNIHRRVDIIISPWRTVGCAVTGWSGGTTFQRDLRRYAKYTEGWKFDSSGVRSRVNGETVDLEGFNGYAGKIGEGRAKTMEEAEKRVFEGFGLTYREPWDRCTG